MKFKFILKWHILILMLRFYRFCNIIFLVFYHILSHIYHIVWIFIIFECLLYFNLIVFLLQISDSISIVDLCFKFVLRKIIPFALTLIYFGNVSSFSSPSPWWSTHHTPPHIFLSCHVFVTPPTLMKISMK